MRKLNPIERSQYINKRYNEYLRSSFQFGDDQLQKLFQEQLEKEVLFRGPYVDLNLPFKRGKSIQELIDEGVVSSLFHKLNDINYERPLYAHQEEAIRHIGSGRGAIVTTGTGSGKTECFLYPILNDILKDIENGKNDIGIRAIFLYPMNALVNDQMDRVRKILSNYPDIKFGFFTGDTEEKGSPALRKRISEQNNVVIPSNELVARDEIRETPPHLLFTNYSMLEYLLIRPRDSAIFKPNRIENWRYVVLDEAHSYYGALGIELSMLMRRLTALAEQKPRFILTSATLGEQGKSEHEIVNFAKNLTSYKFVENDIIFSKRIPLRIENTQYRICGNDYILIKENLDDKDFVCSIVKMYLDCKLEKSENMIYELLIHDKNVYDVYNLLFKKCKTFEELHKSTQVQQDELIALIDLINYADKEGLGILDLKYHSFVRPLSGAYITLGQNSKLTLTKTNQIEGIKAFEIGNCRYCTSPYIIGKIHKNIIDGLDYLFQNNEIDIYENYGDNADVKLDYFLLKNAVNEDEVESKLLEEYELCTKCGAIHSKINLNAIECNCEDSLKISVYKVLNNNDTGNFITYNNINVCPCCGHKSNSGVVKNLNLGKDEGTALIAQILYEAIDENEEKKETGKHSLSLSKKFTQDVQKSRVKQFLSFSDSRQQASFAATFFNANHDRMLRKRLIWKIVEDHNYEELNVDELGTYLRHEIKTKNLFSNQLNNHKNAWITILIDLLKVDGSFDGEGLGLYYFDLDLSDIAENLSDEDIEQELSKYHLNKQELLALMQVVFIIFKTVPAINYVKSTLTPEEKKEYLEFRRFDNYVMYNCSKSTKGTRSFTPIRGENNIAVRYVQKACKCNSEEAIELLEIVFNNLAVAISEQQGSDAIFIKHENSNKYQTNSSRYIIKNYKTSKYYRCSKCGKLTPYNVHNVCPQDKCDGTLLEVDPDEVLATNFYRNEYKTKKIESIVIKEHTAQIARKEAKQYQNDFKNKKINILSCSTTFEMGIDIGDLETVFMRNVPPTPANYVQRAGRAGRRKDSSVYVLTYCGIGSHDYTYFNEPEKMILGIINPPYFSVENKKIIYRHLMAASLGFFFKKNPDYFKTIDGLVFNGGDEILNEYLHSKPHEIMDYVDNRVIPENNYKEYHNFKWLDKMGDEEKMSYFISTIRKMKNEYEEAKQQAIASDELKEAAYFDEQIKKLHQMKVIDSLSRYCVIPKYGFPVDLVDLKTYEDGHLIEKYDLSRDLRIAISEYAPDSEIIVDGKKYTSKYITLPKTGEIAKHYFCECPKCRKINVSVSSGGLKKCSCGQDLADVKIQKFIQPLDGFMTGVTKESSHLKPKRSYAGEVSYIGGGIKDSNQLNLNNILLAESSSNDELLVVNRSCFYMCPVCGYSEITKLGNTFPQISKTHKNHRQYSCPNEKLDLIKLGHKFQTDVVRFIIPLLTPEDKGYSKALSFLYSMLEGVSIGLGIERNDLDGILELNPKTNSYDILLFDNVPGGAGHVKRLIKREAIITSLENALYKVSQNCCDEETSCYNCLRNYYNQSQHNKLKRKYAKEIISVLLDSLLS